MSGGSCPKIMGKAIIDGLCCGLLGALAYFAKAYAFPFFILHFTLMNLCRYYGAAEPALRKRIWRSFGSGMLTFMFVASPWIYALYEKYDQLTFSTIGSYNFQLVNSEPGSSLLFSGFSAPTNPTAISAWEDPTRLAEGRWKPLDLPRTIQNTLSRICANALKTLEALSGRLPVLGNHHPFFHGRSARACRKRASRT